LPEDASLQQILQALKEHRFSRIPIMDRTGSFIGIFFSRDLLPYLKKPESFTGIRELARPPHYVSSRSRVYDLLRDFRSRKKHMAFVRDERGEVIGLVTLDDILESLFKLESKAKSGVQK
ncbi:MAG TPA: CBS domain-containing protein, partial [Proteobacteria bacterium]|nr:CBS domain-containing protein [Pseudomonadota bacterium]